MDFEQMKTIWNDQQKEPLYTVDQKALHDLVMGHKQKAAHVSNFVENLLLFANCAGAIFIVGVGVYKDKISASLLVMVGFMLLTAGYIMWMRMKRKQAIHQYDNTLLGNLNQAISNATYQVRLSMAMLWYVLPLTVLMLVFMWERDASPLMMILMAAGMAVTFFLGRWEHRGWYVSRRERLVELRRQLLN